MKKATPFTVSLDIKKPKIFVVYPYAERRQRSGWIVMLTFASSAAP